MPVNLTPTYQFSGPPGWPIQPYAWEPPAGWEPDPTWPKAPTGWKFWSRTTRADTHLLDHPMKKDPQQRLRTVVPEPTRNLDGME
jgi:hypothetical protein